MNKIVQPKNRSEWLRHQRQLKMARSAHAYVRGNTAQFYEWLENVDAARLPSGPPVWICGDCHSGNIGPVGSLSGDVEIQIRDLDQTVIGNPAHDLVRLGLSLAMAARGSDLPGVTTAQMIEQLVDGYEAALDVDNDEEDARPPDALRVVMKDALKRRWKHLAKERLKGTRPRIKPGGHFWPVLSKERRAIDKLFSSEALRHLITRQFDRDRDAPVEVLDAAFWVKGCSSLGNLRFAVLVRVGGDADDPYCIMDIKEALQTVCPGDSNSNMPKRHAQRVVEGARNLSPLLGERMLAAEFLDREVFVRELFPQDLKFDLDRLTQQEAGVVARYLGGVVGRAHGRQLDAGTRRRWRRELSRNWSRTLEAPSWLWGSVVELVATHEVGYLNHCRRFAMERSE